MIIEQKPLYDAGEIVSYTLDKSAKCHMRIESRVFGPITNMNKPEWHYNGTVTEFITGDIELDVPFHIELAPESELERIIKTRH